MPFEYEFATPTDLKKYYDGEKAAEIAKLFVDTDTIIAFVTLAGVLGKFIGIISEREGVPEEDQLDMQSILMTLMDDARKKVYEYESEKSKLRGLQ